MSTARREPEDPTMEQRMSAFERYERGLLLKEVKIFDSALEEFQHAAADPQHAGKAHTQMALCLKSTGRHEEAVAAFCQALKSGTFSPGERLHILYLLGKTLEPLGRYEEALEIYRWIIREDPDFQDVGPRIKHLSSAGRGSLPARQSGLPGLGWKPTQSVGTTKTSSGVSTGPGVGLASSVCGSAGDLSRAQKKGKF